MVGKNGRYLVIDGVAGFRRCERDMVALRHGGIYDELQVGSSLGTYPNISNITNGKVL